MTNDLNKPMMGDSIKVDLAFKGYWRNTIHKKYTYGWLYKRLREGKWVNTNYKYADAIIEGLKERMGQKGYPVIDVANADGVIIGA